MFLSISSLSRSSGTFAAHYSPPTVLALILAGTVVYSWNTSPCLADDLQFNRDIRPILSENCFACHGPDSAARKGDLRLDRRDDAVHADAISPHSPEESELVRRIFAADPDEVMPPPASHKTLSAEQMQTLHRWIVEGAVYEQHWSTITPRRPAPPKVNESKWVRNPIDRFVLQKLEQQRLSPAPEADRNTLVRRLSLDLTGLPPSPDDVRLFVNDQSPDAYEKLVDRLTASPHWGEHRARYWLDVARYADTHGIHKDNYREMWAYRDWVIQSFNRNQSFEQFTIEQLAGDLLPDSTLDQQIATGFNRCNVTTSEGGAIAEEYLVLYARDRTETMSQAWLGLTAGCAVCHDHKFDPFRQSEFYQLSAFFNNTTQAAMDGNVKDTPPVMVVPQMQDRARWKAAHAEVVDAEARLAIRKDSRPPEFDRWLNQVDPANYLKSLSGSELILHIPLIDPTEQGLRVVARGESRKISTGRLAWEAGWLSSKALKVTPEIEFELADIGNFDRGQSFSCGMWIRFPTDATTGLLLGRMEHSSRSRGWKLYVQDNRIGLQLIHQLPDDALKSVARSSLQRGEWHHVLCTYDGSSGGDGIKIYYDGQPQAVEVIGTRLTNSTLTTSPLKLAESRANQRINDVVLQDVRVYDKALNANEVKQLAQWTRLASILSNSRGSISDVERMSLFDWWLNEVDSATAKLRVTIAALNQELTAIRQRGTITHVMQEDNKSPMAHVLHRGEYDKRRDRVEPATPELLPHMPPELPRNRLGLAQWLMLPEHPLTSRVTVNRFWQEVFGTGLVATPGDFGVSGQLPSNQDLLDWLSVEFRESGWDVKRLFKLMVSSATYRQAALTTAEKRERDPANRWLSRGPRFRMDAEMIRDQALAVSGLLVHRLGGPSVKPSQPSGVWEAVAMPESNTARYSPDSGESLHRRSLYTFWKRTAPPASMELFNAPTRESCVVCRDRTNTPLQALVTLNDPQHVESARHLAQELLKSETNSDNRLRQLALRLLSRPWSDQELAILKNSLGNLLEYYASNPDEAKQLVAVGESALETTISEPIFAGWTMLVNQTMNLDEFLNK